MNLSESRKFRGLSSAAIGELLTVPCRSQPTSRMWPNIPKQTDWPFVARESCSQGMPPQNTLVVCSRTLEIESPELPLSQPWHRNTTKGGISHGIFCNHSNVSFPIVCQPLLEPQLSKQQQTQAAFPPGSHSACSCFPSVLGSWCWSDIIGSARE